ncbi:MAG: hypothetical protein QM682_04700 [Paracoccus sp. (in: a-proteobacteria)]|uniref:hypothetical protein n=1 Tax=Paracoccus sp. TaxID=267 RepID=UPI0039E23527
MVALDQMLVYNRFGSFNPYGMIFALRRDVQEMDDAQELPECGGDMAVQPDPGELTAGKVRLRDCHRPRPLVLRANVGDLLYLRVTNLLAEPAEAPPKSPEDVLARELSRDFCPDGAFPVKGLLSQGNKDEVKDGEALCEYPRTPNGDDDGKNGLSGADWPRTRGLNLVAEGLMPLALPGQDKPHPACLGLDAVAPQSSFTCLYEVVQEGTHFFASRAAPAGGEGDGGSITHGLFGAVLAERPGTRWYRSQVSAAAMNAVWAPKDQPRHARSGALDYERLEQGVPVLNMARVIGGGPFREAKAVELVHADLNAIVWCDTDAPAAQAGAPLGCGAGREATDTTQEAQDLAFREFSVFFHDELKGFYTRNFQELARFGQLAGVRDGFAINYGSSGMGTMLLANRKGIGPAAGCAECLYEEFFLTSWANGDPALLEWFPDDPSNVHHSYLNDPVVFRNFHAGPKETHVFHLHAHQWFAGNDPGRGSYLDSQTVGPGQGFTYNIYHGGREKAGGGWYTAGSGNRNRTVGDSIFHCHLYPHFAQGMWALWRVHDVFEDGTRKLPDGQAKAGISAEIRDPRAEAKLYFPGGDPAYLEKGALFARSGSVNPETGAWLDDRDDPTTPGRIEGAGTPVPALVPLPGEALPPLPTYAPSGKKAQASTIPRRAAAALPRRGASALAQGPVAPPERIVRAQASVPGPQAPGKVLEKAPPLDAMPGYPFYVAGSAGHRPPQAPRDIARALNGDAPGDELLTGALGRHVLLTGQRKADLPADIALREAELARTLDQPGHAEELERLRGRIVAKALARGDMTAHLDSARIRLLNPEGEPLEQAAQAFHHDGAGLTVRAPDGTDLPKHKKPDQSEFSAVDGGYPMPRAPLPQGTGQPDGVYQVNGAPPAPGAPFADPCGGAVSREGQPSGTDPLTGRVDYVVDPKLVGFRRYEVSAVQLDLVVNKAGWHDPQARIDVLTHASGAYAGSDGFKLPGDSGARISPTTRDDAEPFFFRARSGECIEFRHTNELPKELDLDDFQVRTPTDTIGQHIHLVKFDVTASDGSGNGWNYEDGTFAADELAARLCAWAATGDAEAKERVQELGGRAHAAAQPDLGALFPDADFCAAPPVRESRLWRLPRGRFPFLFQTTVQRWFADPILTHDGMGAQQDRTMRTVFSHDHFGPSSIQQHGFYTALLIEPGAAISQDGRIQKQTDIRDPHEPCRETYDDPQAHPERPACVEPLPAAGSVDRYALHQGDRQWVGAHKIVRYDDKDPFHPNYREFALAVADFALLYDPRDREAADSIEPAKDAEHSGMARLYCEAKLAETATSRVAIQEQCGKPALDEPDIPPAYWAAGLSVNPDRKVSSVLDKDHEELRRHLLYYRGRAASPDGVGVAPVLAKPVAPPARPESISVDHHDPYLVNYRNAPLPLRLAGKNRDGTPSPDCAPLAMTQAGLRPYLNPQSQVVQTLMQGGMPVCSYKYQLNDDAGGDAGQVLSSWVADDRDRPRREPETPLFEGYQDERLLFRLVQGAQEVQHVFNIAGLAAPRNIDQRFPQGMRDLAVSEPPARRACFEVLRKTHPEAYEDWLSKGPDGLAQNGDYWHAFERALARCDNIEGYTFAQEVGISEHFEIRGRMRADTPTMEMAPGAPAALASYPATGAKRKPDEGLREASDYLYNFGTVDSLWNGAWGLVRIYPGSKARAGLLAAWAGHSAPAALEPVNPGADARESSFSATTDPDAFGSGATCPLPTREMLAADAGDKGPRRIGQNVAGLAVAVRTADVWPGGTDYGAHRHDPDGLMLALLNPQDLKRDITLRDDWLALPRGEVIAAIRRAYARPEPFVMRVNAGDCVTLRYVNLLQETAKGGMPDALGDALMPRIAGLNVDPVPEVERVGEQVTGTLHPTVPDGPITGLRPSARLALSVGLPGGDLIRNLPLGFGINASGLEPATKSTASVSEMFQFYAGRLRIGISDSQKFNDLASDIVNALRTEWNLGDATFTSQDQGQPAHFTLLGRDYWIVKGNSKLELTKEQIDQLNLFAQAELQKHFHWIPYAFGPVPVRVTGDVVSQTTHGLFGVIDVLPQGWAIPASLAPPMDQPEGDRRRLADLRALDLLDAGQPARDARWRAAAAVPPETRDAALNFGAPASYSGVDPDPDGGTGPRRNIREFVIFYQDGLNHHDSRSKIEWRLNGKLRAEKPTPDCAICDDSYDLGEQGVSYRSRPFSSLLRFADIGGRGRVEASDDLNAVLFPGRFFAGQSTARDGGPTDPDRQPLTLMACPGDQVLIRVVHPGGRARQRAFVMNGLGYDDLFAGFGFPNAALVAPGKSVSAWLHPPTVLSATQPGRAPVEGTVLWHDGPNFLMAGGTWGLLEFAQRHCAK